MPFIVLRGLWCNIIVLNVRIKVRGTIFKVTIGNESLHQDSNNGVRIVNFIT